MYMNYALHQCTICDVCTHPGTNAFNGPSSGDTSKQDKSSQETIPSHLQHTLPIDALWKAYAQYKFVFSPWGNGPDCGRTWEIMLAGDSPDL